MRLKGLALTLAMLTPPALAQAQTPGLRGTTAGTTLNPILSNPGAATPRPSIPQASGSAIPTRPDAVKPNSQNLMQGPSYWTPGQRRLNVPNADANPTTRRETQPWPPPPAIPRGPNR
ncbi:hypothetical protein [Ancylobacter mangrovi]|uniref:hypothetical protein n=1 Tax=Ancylobacter mangrovi TaxID=2972472 RepID=UPI0021618A75|nr:hypothetical protein [Ancylobacter mangrovi]MCS0504667.1 hypothetical protein [Ancylobacter mangrovi]